MQGAYRFSRGVGNRSYAGLGVLPQRGGFQRPWSKNIKLVAIAAEGIKKYRRHPDVNIYVAAVDEKLDERGYIVRIRRCIDSYLGPLGSRVKF